MTRLCTYPRFSQDPAGPSRQRRNVRRWHALVVSGAVLAFVPAASAATYSVTTTADVGVGSLRAAIRNANAIAPCRSQVFVVRRR